VNNGIEIMADEGPDPVAAYPHARRIGDLLFISGIGPHKKGEKELPYSFDDEVHGVFHNLKVILESLELDLSHVVDVTGFLTSLETDFSVYNRIYAEYMGDIRPARTTIEVSGLPRGIRVELKVIAACGTVL
jgi:2-aminomuconate deaminase